MADWQKFTLQVPGKDVLEKVRGVLETLMVYLEVLKAILETIKAFLIDFGNPIKVLVEALIKLIMEMFIALQQTGIYGYFDVPEPQFDPNFDRSAGGSQAFMTRFQASLFDDKDPNRPQPLPYFNQAGFIILMVDASSIVRLIRLVMSLYRFFGKEYQVPRYAAPANARVLAVGGSGDPILAVAKIFNTEVTAVAVEWALPTSQSVPNPGFLDVVMNTASEFIPPRFLIEKSTIDPSAKEITLAEAAADTASIQRPAGTVVYDRETSFEKGNAKLKRKERVRDMFGDTVMKFQEYYIVGPSDSPATFWAGQLGKFRWIDTDVKKDQTYYYRIRAFSGSLDCDVKRHQVPFPLELDFVPNNPGGIFHWPSSDPGDEPIMGKASGIFSIRIPKIPPNFDVLANLERLFQTAFSLDFHMAPNVQRKDDTKTGKGSVTPGEIIRPVYDKDGNPVLPTSMKTLVEGRL